MWINYLFEEETPQCTNILKKKGNAGRSSKCLKKLKGRFYFDPLTLLGHMFKLGWQQYMIELIKGHFELKLLNVMLSLLLFKELVVHYLKSYVVHKQFFISLENFSQDKQHHIPRFPVYLHLTQYSFWFCICYLTEFYINCSSILIFLKNY